MIELNEDNYLVYALKNYNSPECSGLDDFEEDVKRFKYLKRLFRRYERTEVLNDRLILNHLIVLNNLFGVENTTRMLEFKLEEEFWPILKTCLLYLGYIDETWKTDIPLDEEVIKRMREL